MKTLLELAYENCDLTFEDIMKLNPQCVERVIYDKIVERAREKIRKCLRRNKMEIILGMIYLICTEDDLFHISYQILGNVTYYRGSIWRVGTYYAVCNYIINKDAEEIIKDIIEVVDMVIHYKNVYIREKVKEKLMVIRETIDRDEDVDICMLADAYLMCGKYLLPYLVDL